MCSPKIKYTTAELLNLKPKAYIAKMDMDICNHIKHLKIKQNLRRKRGGTKICSRIWNNNNGIHCHLLQPLEGSDKNFWNSTELNMALVNLQSLKPKLDMLTHHM